MALPPGRGTARLRARRRPGLAAGSARRSGYSGLRGLHVRHRLSSHQGGGISQGGRGPARGRAYDRGHGASRRWPGARSGELRMSEWLMKVIRAEADRLLELAADDGELRADLKALAERILAA